MLDNHSIKFIVIRIAKRNYYDERFDLAKNNLKET